MYLDMNQIVEQMKDASRYVESDAKSMLDVIAEPTMAIVTLVISNDSEVPNVTIRVTNKHGDSMTRNIC